MENNKQTQLIFDQIIYKGTCVPCKKVLYTKQKECPLCSQPLKSLIILDSLIQSPSPLNLVIIGSSQALDPRTYKNDIVLHIGVTNSQNKVYNFWNQYKIEDIGQNKKWQKALNIPLFQADSDIDLPFFDQMLDMSLNSQKQHHNHKKYHQFDNNCFDFICRFLNDLNYKNNQNWNKELLVEQIIEQKVEKFENFCQIYQNLQKNHQNFLEIELNQCLKEQLVQCDTCDQICGIENRYKCLICEDFDLCKTCFEKINHQHPLQLFW